MRYLIKCILTVVLLILFVGCKEKANNIPSNKLFTQIPTSVSGVTFENKILESEQLHYYKYLYIYIGGGVAAADFNNDGLEDLFFTSNVYHNKLFLNKGDFQFEDITIKSGIVKRPGFDVGVSVVDINNDGFLDIYINRAGWYKGEEKLANILYVNNGDLTFTEQAKKYGLADTNRSIASTFFDYDKDGDLDVYIANAPSGFGLSGKVIDFDKIQNSKETITLKGSDQLYNNDGNGYFTNVTKQAGILPDLGFGLNAQVGDLNNDGWLDVYVSNDFITPDFAYVNNGDGTFTDKRNELFKHMSYYSMGSDIADINNDGFSDLMTLDMSPEDYIRSKTTMSMMPISRFNEMVEKDYHHQYMRNTLQLNNGNETYREMGTMAGLSKTDWSWSTLLADFDLDGFNDAYITNGIYRDVVDRDVNIEINKYIKDNKETLTEKDFYEFTKKLPQQKLSNYFFKNNGNLTFANATENWVDAEPTFSNGAVYTDLDNDGDLDIVVNNIDENATILRNNAMEIEQRNYLHFTFKGEKGNPFGVGVRVNLYQQNNKKQVRQLVNNRGYLSSVANKLYFGVGKEETIPKVEVIWPNDKIEILKDVKVNQLLNIDYKNATTNLGNEKLSNQKLVKEESLNAQAHREILFNDFDKQLLLPHKLSQTGPAYAKADVNKDGLEDIFIGGAHKQEAQLLLASNGGYTKVKIPAFELDKEYEDVSATFLDYDNDGDLDLYVASGSYEFKAEDPLLEDRLYINSGNGKFSRSSTTLPKMNSAGGYVTAADYDEDGDIDIFVGSRVIPGKYPYAPKSYLLQNTKGRFRIKTKELAPELERIGMVTYAVWHDIDKDKDLDLIVTGEWMGIEVFANENGKLRKSTAYERLSNAKGWWNTLLIVDVDNDGDDDIVAGNIGLNYKQKASIEKPFHIYTNDFDDNGIEDIVLAKYYNDKQVPARGKSCSSEQMPYLKEKFKKYNDFANADLQEIFGENLKESLHYVATEFRSGIFFNTGKHFEFSAFDLEAQMAPINTILYQDFNKDGTKDLLMAGNNYMAEVETTRSDAGIGTYLKGTPKGEFVYESNAKSGLYLDRDVRGMIYTESRKDKNIIVINNDQEHQLFVIK